MPETRPPIDLNGVSLAELQRLVDERKLPPVDSWHPDHCGDSRMRILTDGTWLHEGRPITRPAMVRLFSTILRREPDGTFVLVTPVEKLTIVVDSTPFVAVEMRSEGSGRDRRLAFRLNTDDVVILGPEHPLRIEAGDHGPSPRILVRGGLEAALARPVYYELAELALAEASDPPGVWSDGAFFPMATE